MREDIIKLARAADEYADKNAPAFTTELDEWQEIRDKHFAALVLANNPPQAFMSWQEGHEAGRLAEREACARVCESEGERIDASWMSCAAAIRARGG